MIQEMTCYKHHQTSFPLKNLLLISIQYVISAVFYHYVSRYTNQQHRTDLPHIAGLLESPAICSFTQLASSWVEHARWQSLIAFWLEASSIFLKTSHFFSLSFFSPFPQQQVMDPQTPQPGASGSESSRTTGTTSIAPPAESQQQRRHHLVHWVCSNAATANMTLDAHLKIVHRTRGSRNMMQHAIGCGELQMEVGGSHPTIECTAGIRRERHDQFIATTNGKSPWSTKPNVCTVRKIKYHEGVSTGIFTHKFRDKCPWAWAKQAVKTLEEAAESYMVEVIADAHF